MTSMTRTVGLTLVVAAALLIAGCAPSESGPIRPTASAPPPSDGGSLSNSPTPTSPAPSTPTPAAGGPADLTIVFRDGSDTKTTWTLTCDPAGGNHPDPEAACAALADHGAAALPPVPKQMMCTQVYGGPETASITGTWQGRTVTSTFSRTNGCEIARWNLLAGLLPGGTR